MNLYCIFKLLIQSYQIKIYIDVFYLCYYGNVLFINNYMFIVQSYIYIFIYINMFFVILVVLVKYMFVICNNWMINWFFKFFKFYEFYN